ncbi:N-glycosylase/DNA lyase [Megalops cyprinoides]|uniref:N-glycosylase/DNA lyase n=1 Tax=Megalops cyprinoides TaxID=118141 RepID=UPI001864555B|nr:N-glycosylase/DNA lyase [Megalops cyprinoides]
MSQHALLSMGAKSWRSLACSRSELRLDLTLGCGQTFRWRETGEGHWTGVMAGRVWTLTQTDDRLWYHTYSTQGSEGEVNGRKRAGVRPHGNGKRTKGTITVKEEETSEGQEPKVLNSEQDTKEEQALKDYFQLNVKLVDLYKEWGTADHHFKRIAETFIGVRMLRQDPTECLFSFICTSNNHISRIQGMVERLCNTLGAPLCQLDGTSYHDFPTLESLADSSVEACLRDLGFGYRARFLQQSARQILDTHGTDWLQRLRSAPYLEARDALRSLPGVGLKVADCVCLMSLDKACAVPVDTHVWQIARRDYRCGAGTGQKSLTDRVHRDIGDFFRQLWGPYAGWAHSVLFCSDLKKFQKLKEIAIKKEEDVEMKISEKTLKKNGDRESVRRVKRVKCEDAE